MRPPQSLQPGAGRQSRGPNLRHYPARPRPAPRRGSQCRDADPAAAAVSTGDEGSIVDRAPVALLVSHSTNTSAAMRFAIAPSVSPSPKRSVATVSFSLITGIAPGQKGPQRALALRQAGPPDHLGQQHQTHGAAHGTEHRSPASRTHLTYRSCGLTGFEVVGAAPPRRFALRQRSGTHQNHFIALAKQGSSPSPAGHYGQIQPSTIRRQQARHLGRFTVKTCRRSAPKASLALSTRCPSGSPGRPLSGGTDVTVIVFAVVFVLVCQALALMAPAVRASRSSSMAACRAASASAASDPEFPSR